MRQDHGSFVLQSDGGYTSFTFTGKPSAAVRDALKANRYRWSPSCGHWWKATGIYADFSDALAKLIDRENGVRRVDGACWTCKAADGYFRRYGAATPVYCDKCQAIHQAAEHGSRDFIDVDAIYEDSCREA